MANSWDFKIGDVVKLKHGGPNMTVRALNAYGMYDEIETNWFAEDHLCEAVFNVEMLLKVSTWNESVAPIIADQPLPF